MMKISPYLSFEGTCEEAFRFYARVLNGKLGEINTYGNSPMKDQTPPDWHDRVMHVTLEVDGQVLMGADAPPTHFAKAQGTSVSLTGLPVDEGSRVFKALSEGGTVVMPFDKTFWASGFGMCVDRYGIPWMVNCD
jgi:PhnB protein